MIMATKKSFPMPPAGAMPKGLDDVNPSVGAYHAREHAPAKTSGVKVRGGKAQTKGFMARGPMG